MDRVHPYVCTISTHLRGKQEVLCLTGQRSIDMHPRSPATEVVSKVVRKVISKVVGRLIRRVISPCTGSRTPLLTSLLMIWDHGSPRCDREGVAPPPPADEGDIGGEAI